MALRTSLKTVFSAL